MINTHRILHDWLPKLDFNPILSFVYFPCWCLFIYDSLWVFSHYSLYHAYQLVLRIPEDLTFYVIPTHLYHMSGLPAHFPGFMKYAIIDYTRLLLFLEGFYDFWLTVNLPLAPNHLPNILYNKFVISTIFIIHISQCLTHGKFYSNKLNNIEYSPRGSNSELYICFCILWRLPNLWLTLSFPYLDTLFVSTMLDDKSCFVWHIWYYSSLATHF